MSSELIERLNALRDFLNGERALDGTWFDDNPVPMARGGRFWWRKMMRRELTRAADTLSAQQGRIEALEEALRPFAVMAAGGENVGPKDWMRARELIGLKRRSHWSEMMSGGRI